MTAFRRYDNFTIEDQMRGRQIPGGLNERGKTLGPVVAAPGEKANVVFALVQLQPVAVEFDFMKPLIAARDLLA
jgi:hypothetical protein